ncbi:hypothetical protein Q1W73_01615 [Asticcacaulis sp. ZE23SCel15]|uniref:hypothetical protein n=1 Tax=Asticcacaulis sp. ZE23SCel15 TaxID=3059027 RepID=UPI00265DB27C|nr:hypothetical protein [Asticcacaulis sp. ZE23SCel15]WKL57706.1 hypothetical protein Q1W73_01615 [Asticcacaulis sp. ZE23SCel15]
MSDAVRCHKRWGFVAVIGGLNVLMALIFIATLLLDVSLSDPFARIAIPAVGVALLLFCVFAGQKIKDTSLYVLDDGVGVQYNHGPIKKITWDNIDNLGQDNDSLSVVAFRLKSYEAWFNQFSDEELRKQVADGDILFFLMGWSYLKRRPISESITQEIALMPKGSPKRILANRMAKSRGEQGVDLVFGGLCSNRDLELFEASYLRWKTDQASKEVGA